MQHMLATVAAYLLPSSSRSSLSLRVGSGAAALGPDSPSFRGLGMCVGPFPGALRLLPLLLCREALALWAQHRPRN